MGSGPPPPPESKKNMGFLSNTDPDPLKNHKATKPAFNLGNYRQASGTPFRWCFAGGLMIACL